MNNTPQTLKNWLRKAGLALGAGLVLSGVVTTHAANVAMTKLREHTPSVVAQLKAIKTVPAEQEMNLAIGLPLRNQAEMSNLLAQIYDPASTNYHRYLTPEEFTAWFGPTEADYAMVINFARMNGLEVTRTHPNRVLVEVKGKASVVEKAFNTSLKFYRHPKENRDFFAPETAPSVPASLPILDVSGLENYYVPHPQLKPTPVKTANATPKVGSGPSGSYQGSDFRKAYVPGTTLTGAGQNVALVQFDGFYMSDILAYASQIGLTNPPNVVVVPVNGGVPTPSTDGSGEVSLDIEMVMSMSPGVSNIYVYEAPNPSPWVTILNQIANDNLARQVSCSWGGGPQNAAGEQIFQQMALQGQSFFNATGDYDAFDSVVNPILFPSDSPHITQVGGTYLTTRNDTSYSSETVWNWNVQVGPGYDVGSSGGISQVYTIPAWQTNINFAACQGSATMRNVPDVALTAENVWVIYGGGLTGVFGGTSVAAPLWAGYMALVNEQASQRGLAPIGFINPAIYHLANTRNYTNYFHDITTGNNTCTASPYLFYAATNYDLCTGLGTPNGTNLINALTPVSGEITNPVTHLSPPPPPYGATLAGLNGGNPNGAWQLFVLDDAPFNVGVISNGWILNLTLASPVGQSANLALTMTVSASSVVVGKELIYTLTLTNFGPSVSSNIVVADNLSLNATLLSAVPSQGSVAGLNWNVGNLATNGGASLVMTVRPNVAGTMVNYAIANADTPDANLNDNYAEASVSVVTSTPPLLTGPSIGSGGFTFTVNSPPGVTSVIQACTNLAASVWVPVYTNIGTFTYTNSDTSNYLDRFFRVVVP